MKTRLPKVAAIHDLSGYGRASLTAIMPTLSTMGVQVCPLPTAVLSNHTGGFEHFSYVDLTDTMGDYIARWKEIGIDFDCIYSGFLGSKKQIDIVSDFIDDFRRQDTLVVIDPVMGDDGRLYKSFTWDFVPLMQTLIKKADIITPNYTEAAFLLGHKEAPEALADDALKEWLYQLSEMGPEIVVITSVPDPAYSDRTHVVAYDKHADVTWKLTCHYIPAYYPGTGDTFTSVLIGKLLQNESLPVALDFAIQFISQCIKASYGFDYPKREGVLLERQLSFLSTRPVINDFETI